MYVCMSVCMYVCTRYMYIYIYMYCVTCAGLPSIRHFRVLFLGSMRCETMPVHQNGWFLLLRNKSNKGFEVPEKISNQITVAELEAALEDGFQACHFFYRESGRLKSRAQRLCQFWPRNCER